MFFNQENNQEQQKEELKKEKEAGVKGNTLPEQKPLRSS